MADYDNTNRGVLFPKTPESDKHPNYSGEINVEGKMYMISAWNKVSKTGNNYKSISITPKNEYTPKSQDQHASNYVPSHNISNDNFDQTPINLDDIPF